MDMLFVDMINPRTTNMLAQVPMFETATIRLSFASKLSSGQVICVEPNDFNKFKPGQTPVEVFLLSSARTA